MDFISNQQIQNRAMMDLIGIKNVEELFSAIPRSILLKKPTFDDGLSEFEGLRYVETILNKNRYQNLENYLGAGSYEHHVPALVGAICSKSEFLTSYTPYQAEASQGMLQAIFEFQSAMCALTGLDFSNASLYDGASACAEAVLMALRYQKRNKIIIADSMHPHYRAVVKQYVAPHASEIDLIAFDKNGKFDIEQLKNSINDQTAAVLIQSPNFFGSIEPVKMIAEIAKKFGALTILCANPLSFGLFASPAELGADIAVGDCQPFGIPLQFGGPYAGYICCKEFLLRQLPGRIVGETVDIHGKRGFVLTLQAREQHIRREKATSNICTNQALAALASLLAILWYGKKGLAKLALTNYQRSSYLKQKLDQLGFELPFKDCTTFNESVVRFPRPLSEVQECFHKASIEPGLDLSSYYSQFKDCLLVAVTETKSKEQLDRYCQIAECCK